MKALFVIGLLIIICGDLHAQSSAADSLKAYIKSEGYVPITYRSKMPKAMLPYYNIIMNTINNNAVMKNWYIRLSSFESDTDFILFDLYPLSAIVNSKKFDDRHIMIAKGYKITPIMIEDIPKDTFSTKNVPAAIVDKIQIIDDGYGRDTIDDVSKIQVINNYGVRIIYLKKSHQIKMSPALSILPN